MSAVCGHVTVVGVPVALQLVASAHAAVYVVCSSPTHVGRATGHGRELDVLSQPALGSQVGVNRVSVALAQRSAGATQRVLVGAPSTRQSVPPGLHAAV